MLTLALQGLWLFAVGFLAINAVGVLLLDWFD